MVLYEFWVCNIMIQQYYTLLIAHYDKCTPNPHHLSHSSSHPFSPWELSVCFLYSRVWSFVCLSLFFLVCSFALFLKFHICMKSYGICLSLSDLLHLPLYCLALSMLLQTARFPLLLGVSNIPLCVYIYIISSLSMGGYLGYISILAIVNIAII